jgi:hypothetical protein
MPILRKPRPIFWSRFPVAELPTRHAACNFLFHLELAVQFHVWRGIICGCKTGPTWTCSAITSAGNWDYNLASHRGLDPRHVWKLEADFEPVSGFARESLATVLVHAAPGESSNKSSKP